MRVVPYNPLDKNSIGDNIVRELAASPIRPLPVSRFEGAGIYALYYVGDFPAYARITEANKDSRFEVPIYIGKADPKGALELDSADGTND